MYTQFPFYVREGNISFRKFLQFALVLLLLLAYLNYIYVPKKKFDSKLFLVPGFFFGIVVVVVAAVHTRRVSIQSLSFYLNLLVFSLYSMLLISPSFVVPSPSFPPLRDSFFSSSPSLLVSYIFTSPTHAWTKTG